MINLTNIWTKEIHELKRYMSWRDMWTEEAYIVLFTNVDPLTHNNNKFYSHSFIFVDLHMFPQILYFWFICLDFTFEKQKIEKRGKTKKREYLENWAIPLKP